MQFRTPVTSAPAPLRIDHHTRLLLVGSCFTTHISARLQSRKFTVHANPFGVLYNPVSMAYAVRPSAAFAPSDFFEHEGIWRHWDLHSELAAPVLDTAVLNASTAAEFTRHYSANTDVLVLTFGTADVHFLVENNRIVANNHKMPAGLFGQKRLDVKAVVDTVAKLAQELRILRPQLQIVLTVSPVRHLRGGAVANQRSKATLLLACEELCAQVPGMHYFPAYELMMDDLRDYRFYAPDMVHPSEVAVDYIWERFEQTYFTPETVALSQRIMGVVQAAQHRPFNPDTVQHRRFVEKQLAAIAALEAAYPWIDFGPERQGLRTETIR